MDNEKETYENYASLLKKYIKQSNLKLEEISDKLNEQNLSASTHYLSKLQNGKLPPGSKELNNALAEITNGNKEKLEWFAYLEKAPELAKNIFGRLDDKTLNRMLELDKKFPEEKFSFTDKDSSNMKSDPLYKETNNKISEIVKGLMVNGEDTNLNETTFKFLVDEFKGKIDLELDKDKYLKMLKEYGLNLTVLSIKNNIGELEIREDVPEFNTKFLQIPLLGHIAAGRPILANDHIEEYVTIPSPGNYKSDDLFMLEVKGDSMIGSRIYEGDRVLVKMQQEVENGEIAVVNVNGDEATLKKVKKLENGQTLLIASNDKYDPIIIDNENARIVGKVIQVIFEP